MSNSKSFQPVLGRVPSGIFILTIGTGPRATGMLSSWVMQAGFEPPMVSVAVKQGRYVCDWITAGEPFVLNLVGESQQKLMKHLRMASNRDRRRSRAWRSPTAPAACRSSRTRSATWNANRSATSTPATIASS